MQRDINLDAYPINCPGNKLDMVISRVRMDLETDGCAILRDFLSVNGVNNLIKEANSVAHNAHY